MAWSNVGWDICWKENQDQDRKNGYFGLNNKPWHSWTIQREGTFLTRGFIHSAIPAELISFETWCSCCFICILRLLKFNKYVYINIPTKQIKSHSSMWWHGESTVSSSSESHSVVSDFLQPRGLYSPWNSPGQTTGGGSLSLLQRIFPTLGSNLGLLHGRQILLPAEPQGKTKNTRVGSLAYPFSSGSSWPRNRTRVSCIAGGFFTNWAIREALSMEYKTLKKMSYQRVQDILIWRGKWGGRWFPHHAAILGTPA